MRGVGQRGRGLPPLFPTISLLRGTQHTTRSVPKHKGMQRTSRELSIVLFSMRLPEAACKAHKMTECVPSRVDVASAPPKPSR
jgi:hypothetical protein